ncbi:MAG: chemotaxis protein CheD [Limnochordia bacterium]
MSQPTRCRFNEKLQREVCELFLGEYHVAVGTQRVLSTLLGSCVAVCLYDSRSQVYGMNHFMIPGDLRQENFFLEPDARYGIFAMELLINGMMKAGAAKERLRAKIFGGGRLLALNGKDIAGSNIRFAQAFLEMEGIPIEAADTGERVARRLFFMPQTHVVYVRKLPVTTGAPLIQQEEAYARRLQDQGGTLGELTLFGGD